MKLLALIFFAISVASAAVCSPKPMNSDAAFCKQAPVDPVSLPDYMGTWYQLYLNQGAQNLSNTECGTAKYTLNLTGFSFLKCNKRNGKERAQCIRGQASQRPDGGGSSSRFQIDGMSPSIPIYRNIAALLGDKEYGYYAAAIYSCKVINGKVSSSWFFQARNPYRPYRTLMELIDRLRAKGYKVPIGSLLKTRHSADCVYFFQPSGFDSFPVAGP